MRIRDGDSTDPGWKKVGSGINIPDPPHCGSVSLTNGSGCGSGRPKNIWILQIRMRIWIRNTGSNTVYNSFYVIVGSVADPGCLSRILDPDFYPYQIRISDFRSQIPDLGSPISDLGSNNSNKREGGKKFVALSFLLASGYTKL